MSFSLKDQIAIVTGGTSGIGKAIAKKFLMEGAKVIIFGTNTEKGNETVNELKKESLSNSISFSKVDVSNNQQVKAEFEKIINEFNQLDILVNNAGITCDQLLMRMSENDWDNVMAVNVKSCYNTCHAAVRSMMRARKGKIINMSSVVGLKGNVGQSNYAASKAAIIGFTKALAKELASRNICVNCVAPGFIKTRMTEGVTEEQKKEILTSIPLGRMGDPDEIAYMVWFLASSFSNYITGQVISVDGGIIM